MPENTPQFDPHRFGVVAIGSSTGAPNLILHIITRLPADLPVPILIAQHLPPRFTADLAVSINRDAPLTVVEAEDGQPVFPGTVYLGKGRVHLRVIKHPGRAPTIQISDKPENLVYKPSVDQLFASCAKVYGRKTLGIVMTGIGRDGVKGAADIVNAGGVIVTQSKPTCAVYGMPRACDEAGLSTASLSPEQIRDLIHQLSPSYQQTPSPGRPGLSA